MKLIYISSLILISLILQSKVAIFGVSPNLTALITYYYGISNGTTKGLLAGSFIGLLEDSAGGGIIGPNILGKGMVGFFSSFISIGLLRWTPYIGALAIFVLTAIDGLAVFISKTIFGTAPASLVRLAATILISGLLNSAAGAFARPKNAD